jgi:hypothetical protein
MMAENNTSGTTDWDQDLEALRADLQALDKRLADLTCDVSDLIDMAESAYKSVLLAREIAEAVAKIEGAGVATLFDNY